MSKAFISLGTNMGDKLKNLHKAINEISLRAGKVELLSGMYETEPWGFSSDEAFINMVILIESNISPDDLMKECLDIEQKMGRIRDKSKSGYQSRIIDIDILFYDGMIISDAWVKIPHPLIQYRRFILEPLCDIAKDFIHPVLNKSISELLSECQDEGKVRLYQSSSSV
jgi:2-amino-4-hydroxy-6-hydroxymethyldihydropteridine diphosphokinase